MLWILTGIGLILIGAGMIYSVNSYGDKDSICIGGGVVISLIFGIILCCTIQSRHSTIYNNSREIEVLEENNKELPSTNIVNVGGSFIKLPCTSFIVFLTGCISYTKYTEKNINVKKAEEVIPPLLIILPP